MNIRTLIVIGAIFASAASLSAQTIRTVSAISGGPGPWAAPFTTVESALAVSVSGDEVWVAAGSYTSPAAGYALPSGVALRGGFAGTETAPGNRDPNPLASVTTLNGNNNRTILTSTGASAATLLERFTLTGGRGSTPDATGGAIRLNGFLGTIRACKFIGNASNLGPTSPLYTSAVGGDGGAVWMTGSTPQFIDCLFSGNTTASAWGGGCASGTTAPPQRGGSGGAAFLVSSSPTFTNCTFDNNSCGSGGTGASGCSFSVGSGGPGGAGGAVAGTNSSPTFVDCSFTNNRAGSGGAGGTSHGVGGDAGIGGSGGAISLSGAGTATFTHCTFADNLAGLGGRNGLGTALPSMAGGAGGAIAASGLTQIVISRSLFKSNTAGKGGDGGIVAFPPLVPGGGAGGSGGAVFLNNTPATISNSAFTQNAPGNGGNASSEASGVGGAAGSAAIAATGVSSSFVLVNCTLAFNKIGTPGTSNTNGDASACTELLVGPGVSGAQVTNSILWNGFPTPVAPFAGDPVVSYCDVSAGASGVGNIPADPHFVNPGLADFRITRHSACIDAANNVAASAAADLAGNARFRDDPATADTGVPGGVGGAAVIDMGAYEFQPETPPCAGDFNQSGGNEVQDIFDFLAAWFAGNATANYNGQNGLEVQDIFDFLSAWFNGC